MKTVTITLDQYIAASKVTDEGSIRFIKRQFPEEADITVEDSAVVDVATDTPDSAPAEEPAEAEGVPESATPEEATPGESDNSDVPETLAE